jgi:ABC-type uncharacterized transport system substrate-binding protein
MASYKSALIALVLNLLLITSALCGNRVLVVHSYYEDFDWVQGINKGIRENLKSDLEYQTFYMDTKRHPNIEWKKKSAREAAELLKTYHPQVVITVDDNAQRFFAHDYVGKSPIQFVFCGVNEEPEKYGYPAANVTGILERTYAAQVLGLLKRIYPKASNVAWVSDFSPTSVGVRTRVEKLARLNKLPLNIVAYKQPVTFEAWRTTIEALDRDPGVQAFLIPLYHTVTAKSDGQSMLPADVMAWTVKKTSKPIVGFWPFSADDGALCAVAVDPYEHGKVAALMARQILSGKKAGDLPIVTNRNGYVILNLNTANKLGIEIPFEVIQSADRIIE